MGGFRRPLVVDGLVSARAGGKFQLFCENVRGLASISGRRVHVYLSPAEVAKVIGAIPAADLNFEDLRAIRRVQLVLRGLEQQGELRAVQWNILAASACDSTVHGQRTA